MTEEKKIEDMEKEIAELEKKKAEMLSHPPEIPKEEVKEPEFEKIVGYIPDTPQNRKIMEESMENSEDEYTPPDPIAKLVDEPTEIIETKKKFEGGIYIT